MNVRPVDVYKRQDMGYIVQPHTSAGRIPSDKGYRLYVDELMKEKEDEIEEIRNLMIEKTEDVYKRQKRYLCIPCRPELSGRHKYYTAKIGI